MAEIVRCDVCGKPVKKSPSALRRNKHNYCSKECTTRSQITSDYATCLICGKKFLLENNIRAKGHGKTCSKACSNKLKMRRLKKTCPQCGKEFEIHAFRLNQRIFCSRKCVHESRKSKIEIKCSVCGKTFEKNPYAVNVRNSTTCSAKCRAILTGRKLSKENNPNWKGGKSYEPYCDKFNETLKECIRLKFNRTCFLCGEHEDGKKLDVHHVDYNKSQGCSGLKWSLIPLCHGCHSKTNANRWYWFALLRDYWIYDYLDFSLSGLDID